MEILVAGVCAVALVATVVTLILATRSAKRERAEHQAALEELRTEVAQLKRTETKVRKARGAEFIVTDLGTTPSQVDLEAQVLDNRLVLSATLGEPLVKAAAFAHGVRRAVSAENRNRVRFEVRREVKRARKRRLAAGREAVRRQRLQEDS